MRIGRSNLNDLADIVDSSPYGSDFGMGDCDCDGLADVGVNVGVNSNGVKATGGFSWITLALVIGGLYLFNKYVK